MLVAFKLIWSGSTGSPGSARRGDRVDIVRLDARESESRLLLDGLTLSDAGQALLSNSSSAPLFEWIDPARVSRSEVWNRLEVGDV